MSEKQQINFPPFRLDAEEARLMRGDKVITLRPKSLAVLEFLLLHPGQLVTKEELLNTIWPETDATDASLKACIKEIREALDDDSRSPRFIETAHRHGYRFIGQITDETEPNGEDRSARSNESADARPNETSARGAVVGRESALAKMRGWLEKALQGTRQIVFISGETGIGKTTLVETFIQSVASDPRIWIGRGQCMEQFGGGEAYLPVLEAMTSLRKGQGRERLVELLRHRAPTWLGELPSFASSTDREALRREVLGATRERMLREMAEALEALTSETPLVLVLEDLHWSDHSTIGLISALARRREPARLMLIGTYRPAEIVLSGHPLKAMKQELDLHHRSEELAVEFLTDSAIGQYLEKRFPQNEFTGELATLIHGRTEGNPLFMGHVVDYLQGEGLIADFDGKWRLNVELENIKVEVPETIQQVIEKQMSQLSAEQQRTLEAASVAGVEFPALSVAACLEKDLIQTEETCDELARQHQFLLSTGVSEFPDATLTTRYRFIHTLYQNVLYERVPMSRGARFHRLIGERSEKAYRERAGDIAVELAMHFECGRDFARAVQYLLRAAENAARKHAYAEAITSLGRALEMTRKLPQSEQAESRMVVLERLGLARRSMGDMRGAVKDFDELILCARREGNIEREAMALLYSVAPLYSVDRQKCLGVIEQAIELGRSLNKESLSAYVNGYSAYCFVIFSEWRAEHARALEQSLRVARRVEDRALLAVLVGRHSYFLFLRSQYRAGRAAATEGLHLALEAGNAYDYMLYQFMLAWLLAHMGEWGEMMDALEDGIRKAEKNANWLWLLQFKSAMAWLLIESFDYERALELCEQIASHPQGEEFKKFTPIIGVLFGVAHLGMNQPERAFAWLSETAEKMGMGGSLLDWVSQILLGEGLSRYWLAMGDYEQAREHAMEIRQIAARSDQRTYMAIGSGLLAEIAMARGDFEQADAELAEALSQIEGFEARLAELRVFPLAARLNAKLGRAAEASDWHRRSASLFNRLAGSLGERTELRESLLSKSRSVLRNQEL